MASGESNNGNSRMMGGRDGGDENEVRDEQGGWPWRRTRKSTGGRSGSGSVCSPFFLFGSEKSVLLICMHDAPFLFFIDIIV